MATKKTTKTTASKKTAAKKKAPAKKVTAKKKTVKAKKAAPAKSTTKKKKTTIKTTPAKSTKSQKTQSKKNVTKKAAAKKTVEKKAAPVKKTPTKKAAKKTTKAAKKSASKSPAAKSAKTKAKVKVTPVVEESVEAQTRPKSTAKKATTKKTAKKTTRRKSTKAPREKIVAIGKVGQAPRRGADEVAASNPFPVPPQIHEDVEEAPTTPSPEAKAAKKEFKVNDQIVYPAHGVGVIEAIEAQEIVGTKIEVFVIQFDHEKLRLRVPTEKAKAVGMRELSDPTFVDKTIEVLQGRARIKRTMWSRRAQEYEAKINSGNLNSVAEVVRDLYRSPEQAEQSYSERQLFEAALDRMAREVAAVKKIDLSAAISELDASLQKKQIVV